jgi:GntR family transcriptional regulator
MVGTLALRVRLWTCTVILYLTVRRNRKGRMAADHVGYRQLAARIRASIHAGHLPDGTKLPPEKTLAAQYGVSDRTLQRATRLLKAEGLLTARRGVEGTRVHWRPLVRLQLTDYLLALDPSPGGPFERACAVQGLRGYGEVVEVDHRQADADLAGRLGIPKGAGVVYRRRHMRAGETVVQIQEGWLPLDLVAGTKLAGPGKVTEGTYGALDAAGLRPVRLARSYWARMPTDAERAVLEVAEGVPVLVFERLTWEAGGRVVEFLRVVAAGDRHRFTDTMAIPPAPPAG